jgi:hypothetical protein
MAPPDAIGFARNLLRGGVRAAAGTGSWQEKWAWLCPQRVQIVMSPSILEDIIEF